jgi:hypothetical protein
MGLLARVALLPLAPVTGLVWVAERLQEMAEQELNDPVALRRQLAEAEEARAAGFLNDIEYAAVEEAIVQRLLRSSGASGGVS